MILVILASGRGSRLKAKTKSIPKCMIKIGKNRIIDYQIENFKKFQKIIVVTGYRSKIIRDHLKKKYQLKNLFFKKNQNYKNTNMIESLSKTKKMIDDDLIVSYSDIIFHPNIIDNLILQKKTSLPLYKNWFQLWKKRMKNIKEIKNDAENLIVKKNYIISIGKKIEKKIPKLQFMGLAKIKKEDFIYMMKYYEKIKDKKIDMTTFLDKYIGQKRKVFYFKTSKFF